MFRSRFYNNILTVSAFLVSGLAACQSPESKTSSALNGQDSTHAVAESYTPANGNYCYQLASGSQGKDTLDITLQISDGHVSGDMSNRIFEKDARKGALEGSIKGQDISAIWTYSQEGTKDTMKVLFKINKDDLWQRSIKYNAQTQREQTDQNGEWIKVPATNCELNTTGKRIEVVGEVVNTEPQEHGYIAIVKGNDGKTYRANISNIRLERNFKRYNKGDKIKVAGDTVSVQRQMQVQVQEIRQ
ncbi:hypothetical protein [Mucilaginibacter lacusdianchii]|uniref:hypothetical protein n=1 Tax=Mucilaginibacter lacusdianchii TaxID=2684211 RepID=UPI00131B4AAC|nr:hypothetical protein [Mucilaginibacter sp. JXJ CY 39]